MLNKRQVCILGASGLAAPMMSASSWAQQTPLTRAEKDLKAMTLRLRRAEAGNDPVELFFARYRLSQTLTMPYAGRTRNDHDTARRLLNLELRSGAAKTDRVSKGIASTVIAEIYLLDSWNNVIRNAPAALRFLEQAHRSWSPSQYFIPTATAGMNLALRLNNLQDAQRWYKRGVQGAQQHKDRFEYGIRKKPSVFHKFAEMSSRLFARLGLGPQAIAWADYSASLSQVAPRLYPTKFTVPKPSPSDRVTGPDVILHFILGPDGSSIISSPRGGKIGGGTITEVKLTNGQAFNFDQQDKFLYGGIKYFADLNTGGWFGGYYRTGSEFGVGEGKYFASKIKPFKQEMIKIIGPSLGKVIQNQGGKIKSIGLSLPTLMTFIPWELTSTNNPKLTLGDYFAVSRSNAETYFSSPSSPQKMSPKSRLISLFNPTGDLSGAMAEREMVNSILPDHTELKSGLTPKSFLRSLSRSKAGIVYIATHGNISLEGIKDHSKNATRGIALGGGEFLNASDIHNFKGSLTGKTVFLSGCEGARSRTIENVLVTEGTSLVSALLGKGCDGVFASLWKVPDTATAILMSMTLFEIIIRGKSPAEALQVAKKELAKSTVDGMINALLSFIDKFPDKNWEYLELLIAKVSEETKEIPFENPYYWGGFIYYGN